MKRVAVCELLDVLLELRFSQQVNLDEQYPPDLFLDKRKNFLFVFAEWQLEVSNVQLEHLIGEALVITAELLKALSDWAANYLLVVVCCEPDVTLSFL